MPRVALAPSTRPTRSALPRRTVSLVLAGALMVAGSVLTGISLSTEAHAAPSSTVAGRVFEDYNANGSYDTTSTPSAPAAVDHGVGGAGVVVTDAAGSQLGTTTTGADGTYSLPVNAAGGAAVRVQITPPAGWVPAPHGSNSGTTVQFTQLGSAAAGAVNVGLTRPGDTTQTTVPRIVQAQQYGRIGSSNGFVDQNTVPSLTSSRYTTTGTAAGTTGDTTTLATMAQTGIVWGVAQAGARWVFSAASFRRHSMIGPGGLGAIYLTDTTGAANATPLVTIPDAGTDPRSNSGAWTFAQWSHDTAGFPAVGKVGLGGLALTPDRTALFVVNVADRALYRVPLTYASDGKPVAGTPARISLPLGLPGAATGCPATVRPWGASAQNGSLWITETCTGPAASDLRGYVYRYDLDAQTFDSRPAFETGLSGYNRGMAYNANGNSAAWMPWTDTYSTVGTNAGQAVHPQPLLADVIFDANGDMSIGIKDRFADQNGYATYTPDPASTQTVESFSAGDELRACRNAQNGWTLESNGACGTRTSPYAGNNQGPGGGEFYYDNYGTSHAQTQLGGLLQIPGYTTNVAATFDPNDQNDNSNYRSSGQRFQSNVDGSRAAYHTLQDRVNTDNTGPQGSFGKAGGMGDLTALVADAPIEVGNYVWTDADGDGIQDAGEAPLAGVTVRLYAGNATDNAIATAVTDGTGNYYFSSATGSDTASAKYGLPLSQYSGYTVRLDRDADFATNGPLSGYVATVAAAGSDRAIDSDGIGVRPAATVTTGSYGTDDHTVDFGLLRPVTVGNFVWNDTNGNGVQDGGEPGLSGVTVHLTRADTAPARRPDGSPAPATTTTDGNGRYQFTGLAPGAYRVTVDTPAGYTPTLEHAGSAALDSSTGSADSATLTSGGTDTSLDFGFVLTRVAVGDLVFADSDGNGVRDGGEPGISGVRLTLSGPSGAVTDAYGNPVDAVTTDANGAYRFANLPALPAGQHYTVHVDNGQSTLAGAGWTPTKARVGTDRAADSDTSTADSADLTTNGDHDDSLDFGFVQAAGVGDFVWEDRDGNGVQDANEPGIAGVNLTLTDPNNQPVTDTEGHPVGSATTDAQGRYRFPELPTGQQYVVHVAGTQAALSDYTATAALQGADRTIDSDTDQQTSAVLTGPGATDSTLDFGFVHSARVGDFVWNDTDGDGVQDAGESGLAGVTVHLTDLSGQPVTDIRGNQVGDATTDNDGHYDFGHLVPFRRYRVTVDAPAGYAPTLAHSPAATTADDSDDDHADSGLIASGGSDASLDFGFVRGAAVGDFVWDDLDHDGVQDANEPGLAGVGVTISDTSGGPVQTAQGGAYPGTTRYTDATGHYLFDDLAPGTYAVAVTNPDAATYTLSSPTDTPTSRPLVTTTDSDRTLDVGFYPAGSVSVGDYAWADTDRDGVQDAGEPGLAGVIVRLGGPSGAVTDVLGNPVGDRVTSAQGRYNFTALPPLAAGEHYTVTVVSAPAGWSPTAPRAGTDREQDSDSGAADSGALAAGGQHDYSLDFGFTRDQVAVGDRVWVDTNGNGTQDAGEPGLGGVTVRLTDAADHPVTDVRGNPVNPVTSALDGSYAFTGLPSGTAYVVRVESVPSGYFATTGNTGTATSIMLSTDGAHDDDLDFGYVAPASVGDLVWDDADADGEQDAGEPGLAGVPVRLTDVNGDPVTDLSGHPVGAVQTDQDGQYTFDGLRPSAAGYRVVVTTPAGHLPTTGADSRTSPAASGPLVSGQHRDTIDFGFVRPAAVGDFVWTDADRNGVQDTGEKGIAGVVVTLRSGATVLGTATTSSTGRYQFRNLLPGRSYTVTVTGPAGYVATTATTASSAVLTEGGSDLGLDFGCAVAAASVGDLVWDDLNHDGRIDTGEPGLAGVTLNLTDADGRGVTDVDGHPVGPQTSDSSGAYHFTGLPTGRNYRVAVDPTQPALAGYVPAPAGRDSVAPAGSSIVLAHDGDRDATLDFGWFRPAVSVGDRVWEDSDGDGVQGAGEPGIAGVTVTLTGPQGGVTGVDGTPVGPQTTSNTGAYLFAGLPALATGSHYTVHVNGTQPALAGWTPTVAGAGTDRAADSSTATAESGELTSDGAADATLDFGFVRPARMGDFVWVDSDGDGAQDADEPGLAGVVVTAHRADGSIAGTAVTDTGGHYEFAGLRPGSYTVTVSAPAGYAATRSGQGGDPALDSSDSPVTVHLVSGGDDTGVDFGYVRPARIGDFVWIDSDGDGVQDAGEPGLAGATVRLTGPAGARVTDVTGAPVGAITTGDDGGYEFGNLDPGSYRVSVSPPASYGATRAGAGSDLAVDSSSAPVAVTVESGDHETGIDFGFVRGAGVGDFVWDDSDGDGVQDAGEPGIAGVAVGIARADGAPVTDPTGRPVDSTSTTTDASGHYRFGGLAPGRYVVTVTAPAGRYPTRPGAGTDPAIDSTTGPATSTLLVSGQVDSSLDFGFVRGARIGDFVWKDADHDGVQDAAEPGLAGVTVTVTTASGASVRSLTGEQVGPVVTDASGHYTFDDLPPGRYVVHVDPDQPALAGYRATRSGAGADATRDSSTDSAISAALRSGGVDPSLDFGFVTPSVALGDFVWNDLDGDGRQEAREPGIARVRVDLSGPAGDRVTDVLGHPVGPVVTDARGHYEFADLPALGAGQHYTVRVDAASPALAGRTATRPGAGPSAADSSTGSAQSASLTADGAVDPTLDFGFVAPVTVGQQVFLDSDRDGRFGAGDTGIAGVTVTLTDAHGRPVTDLSGHAVRPVVTDHDGRFEFRNLPPGQYVAHVASAQTPLTALRPTVAGHGSSVAQARSGRLTSGQADLTLSFGFVPPARVARPHVPDVQGTSPAVLPPPAPVGAGSGTASTGVPALALLGAALAALGLGGLLILVTRRRRDV